MPLIKSASKRAFGENMSKEMNAGKPKNQSLAIAFSVQRRNKKKKMADGGMIDLDPRQDADSEHDDAEDMAKGRSPSDANNSESQANSESRPMPDKSYNDSDSVSRNRGNKALKDAQWDDNSTVEQAQRPSQTRLSQPKGVGSDPMAMRQRDMHDDEEDFGDSIYPESDKAQPIQRDNEDFPKRQGSSPDMERQHSNKRAAYDSASENQYSEDEAQDNMKKKQSPIGRYAKGGEVSGSGAKTSTTGNKTKTGGSNPGGASTGGAGTVTITTGNKPPNSINVSGVGGKTAARNAGGMDPSDEDDDDTMMAQGGSVEGMEESDESDLLSSDYPSGPHDKQPKDGYDESHDYSPISENPDEANPHTGESENDMLRRHAMERAMFAKGGMANPKLQQSEMEPPEAHKSIADAIMSKRKHAKMMMDDGGEVDPDLQKYMPSDKEAADSGYPPGPERAQYIARKRQAAAQNYADGGMVDLEANSEESPNEEDQMSFKANGKEQYDDSQLSRQPSDSNLKGHDLPDEDSHDMVDQIRRKMRMRRS